MLLVQDTTTTIYLMPCVTVEPTSDYYFTVT